MAELVDALDSKSGFRKGVQVRFLFWARVTADLLIGCFIWYNIGTTLGPTKFFSMLARSYLENHQ